MIQYLNISWKITLVLRLQLAIGVTIAVLAHPDCKDLTSPDLVVDNQDKSVTYWQFVSKKKSYVVTRGPDKGKTNETTRCECETYQKTFLELKNVFDESRSSYIRHRYLLCRDKHVFPDFRSSIPDHGPIFWVDMSENIVNVPKEQCQDAHFNQRQSSLCCTVKLEGIGSKENTYLYHLSDYNTHNISYTGAVFDHLYSINRGIEIFRVRSDNCQEQFKSLYVFGFWQNFAKQNDIQVLLVYGIPGHGKWLVDSMSSFGVKGPLRQAIVRENFWYTNSQDIKDYLTMKFVNDDTKSYFVLDP